MEVIVELFKNLESNNPATIEEAKKKFHEHFSSTKEAWLVVGLFDYYLNTGSVRAIEVLVSVKEPHEKHLFDRILDSIKGQHYKFQALALLGHVVRRHPTWLYKITNHALLKELLRLLKTETDILPLMSALLIVIILLPIIAGLFGPYLQDLFEVFSRLAAWNTNNPNKVPEGHLLHLQVGLYALFNRLYGMYPCNFLSYLRNQYSTKENFPIFSHTIKPMLDTVKMHPLLVTASKEAEVAAARWKKLEANDVIMECAKFYVDPCLDKSKDDYGFRARTASFKSRSSIEFMGTFYDASKMSAHAEVGPGGVPVVGHYSINLPETEVWSPSIFLTGVNTPEPTSVPHTPISQTFTISSYSQVPEGNSPPEAAVEATPESTPIKEILEPSLPFSLPVIHSVPEKCAISLPSLLPKELRETELRVRAGSSGPMASRGFNSLPSTSGGHSQPSSPMKKEPSPFRFPPQLPSEASAFQTAPHRQKDSNLVMQRVQRVVLDRIQIDKNSGSLKPKPSVGYQPSSPLRVISSPAGWDHSNTNSPHPMHLEHTEEDREVESTMRTEHSGLHHCKRGDSVMDNALPDGNVSCASATGEEYDECNEAGVKGCIKGGLHMPDSRSIMNFARQVNRMRFYSQCQTDTIQLAQIGVSCSSSPKESNISTEVKVRRAISCPEMKKDSSITGPLSDLGVSVLDETEEDSEFLTNGIPTQTENSCYNGIIKEEKKRLVSICTQTDDPHPYEFMGYEHLFLSVFPPIEQIQQHSAPPDVSTAPSFTDSHPPFSPHSALESYIETTVRSLNERIRNHQEVSLEAKSIKDQLTLLTLQLQYERHRREVHAERNRRLLGKSRNNRALEEHNSALRDQVLLMEKEIDTLRRELDANKRVAKTQMDKLQQNLDYWQEQSAVLRKECEEHKAKAVLLDYELQDEKAKLAAIAKEFSATQAEVFELRKSLNQAYVMANAGREVKNELAHLQHQLAAAGELEERLRSTIASLLLTSQKEARALMVSSSYSHSLSNVQQNLEMKQSALEAAYSRIEELKNAVDHKDTVLEEQKDLYLKAKDEFSEKVKSLEKQRDDLRKSYNHQEQQILELRLRLEACKSSVIPPTPLSPSLGTAGSFFTGGDSHASNLQLFVESLDVASGSNLPTSPT